jgi:undecaprenyl-diphosphatase
VTSSDRALSPSRPWYHQRWALILAGFAAAYLTGVLFALVVKSQGDWSHGMPWERAMLRAVHPALPDPLDRVMMILPWFGTNISLIPVVLLIVIWLWARLKLPNIAMWLLVVQLGSYALNPALKATFNRIRPDLFEKRGWYGWTAYPSGHAIASISVLFTIAMIIHRQTGWRWQFYLIGLIAVGALYSRLYLGVHWPTDVFGGVLVGLVWLWASCKAFEENPVRGFSRRFRRAA